MIQKFQYTQADINTRTSRIAQFDGIIGRVAAQQGVAASLIKAIIAVESSGDPNAGASRTTGAKGLMQIIDQTWRGTVQRFPNVSYNGAPLPNYLDREAGGAWSDPELNIIVGTLALKLKAVALTKLLGVNISTDDPNDQLLLLTTYNAGEATVAEAFKNAVSGGSRAPHLDFLDGGYLRPAIQAIVTRYNLGWNIEAKVKEISEYGGRVLTFLDLYTGGGGFRPTPTPTPTPTPQPTNPTTTTGAGAPRIYAVVGGDTGLVIARKLGVSFESLQAANPAVNWNRLSIGERIVVPGTARPTNTNPAPTPTPQPSQLTPRSYVVQRGEGLATIAGKFGVSIESLKSLNAAKLKRWGNVEGFSVGDTILIPTR